MPRQKIIASKLTASVEQIESRIFIIRGQRVMLDTDLAELYGVETKRLNEQMRRNSERFPEDFMFRLTAGEKAEVVANCDHLAKLICAVERKMMTSLIHGWRMNENSLTPTPYAPGNFIRSI